MSKIEQFTNEGFAKPDPNDSNRTILTFEVSVFNPVIEGGFVEAFAQMKNWDGEGSACEGISNWLKKEASKCGEMIYVQQALLQAEIKARAEFEQML